jgi:hypothetical protein
MLAQSPAGMGILARGNGFRRSGQDNIYLEEIEADRSVLRGCNAFSVGSTFGVVNPR